VSATPPVEGGGIARIADHAGGPTRMDAAQARRTVQALVDRAIERLPHRYDGEKDWQRQKQVWAGIKIRREGLKWTTKRRWRDVRHGLQTRYRVEFPGPPETRPPVAARIVRVERVPGDAAQRAEWEMEAEFSSPLDFSARVERWNWGVQWYSVEISGHMTVRLRCTGRLSAYPDFSEIPPAVAVDPRVLSAEVQLDEFHVDRISKVGGEVAEQWGELAKKIADEILLEKVSESLPSKLNRAIDKRREALRFSAADWLSRWTIPADPATTTGRID
jgi:hypothetical protein